MPPCGPEEASTAISAASAAAQPSTTSPSKSGKPGVSMRLMRTPFHSIASTEAEIEYWCFFSSSSKSETVLPSSTRPRREMWPAQRSIASASVVLPAPP